MVIYVLAIYKYIHCFIVKYGIILIVYSMAYVYVIKVMVNKILSSIIILCAIKSLTYVRSSYVLSMAFSLVQDLSLKFEVQEQFSYKPVMTCS